MRNCPMCGKDRGGDADGYLPLCCDCDAKIESVLGAGFEGCQFIHEDRVLAYYHWNNHMKWFLSELFVRVARLEDARSED